MATKRRRQSAAARKSYHETSDDDSTDPDELLPNYANGGGSESDDGRDAQAQDKGEESDLYNVSDDDDQLKISADDNAVDQKRESPVAWAASEKDESRKKKKAVPKEDEEEDEAFEDFSESAVTKQPKSKKEPLVCPNCNRSFAAKHSLRYHVNNQVCQKKKTTASGAEDKDPEATMAAQDKAVGGKKAKSKRRTKKDPTLKSRDRGPESDRTCPQCNRVFTSILGFQYHRDNKVCDKRNKQAEAPFYALKPGQQFILKYGVVEVVRDDRETPLAKPTTDLQAKMKRFTSTRVKRDAQWKKRIATAQVNSATRRRVLSKYYEKHSIALEHVLDAYDLKAIGQQRIPKKPIGLPPGMPPDPTTPEGSYPDRIVECKWIADTRPREEGESWLEMEGRSTKISEGKLFLQRRLLTSPYSAETPRIYCPRCWQSFVSKSGYRHHYDSRSCLQRAEKNAAEKQVFASSIDFRVRHNIQQRFRRRKVLLGELLDGPSSVEGNYSGDSDREDAGILTFDGEETDERPRQNKKKAATKKVVSEKVKEVKAVKSLKSKAVEPLVSPDVLLLELQSEYHLLQGRLLGSVYPEVWKSLGFKKPRKNRKRRSVPKQTTARNQKRQRSSALSVEEKIMVPLAPSVSDAPKTVSFSESLHCFADLDLPVKNSPSPQLELTQHYTNREQAAESAARIENDAMEPVDRYTESRRMSAQQDSMPIAQCQAPSVEEHELVADASPVDTIRPANQCNVSAASENEKAVANPGEQDKSITDLGLLAQEGLPPQRPVVTEPVVMENLHPPFVQTAAMQPFRDPFNLPQMVDIRVFIGEVDSGRYPSMKRHTGTHDEICVICRSKVSLIHAAQHSRAAQLLHCTYCRQSVHFNCVGTRYRLKFPEPNEEFMCHHCISMVCQRRKRAEKRRLEKLGQELPSEAQEKEEREKRFKRATKLLPGEEFECVAEQGKRCEDLGVLLRDARSRLDVCLKIARGNDTRKQLIQAMEGMQ